MANNFQRLGDVLSGRMKRTSDAAVPICLELGTVNANLSISMDILQATIPKGDYMVNIILTGSYSISGGSHSHGGSDHSHSGGSHSHTLRGLQAGDRVLVAWCGNEPVVIAIVVGS